MNEGRWVWCPPRWKVVPEEASEFMLRVRSERRRIRLDVLQKEYEKVVYADLVAAAPEPPSGWHRGYPPDRCWRESYAPGAVLGYWDRATSTAWWAEMPAPPQEDKPDADV